jgi:hypothetical protein
MNLNSELSGLSTQISQSKGPQVSNDRLTPAFMPEYTKVCSIELEYCC